MTLLASGFWPSTYWPSSIWVQDYWPEYGTVAPTPYVDGGSPTIPKPQDLSIPEYGLIALLVGRWRRKRAARVESHV